MSTKTRTRKSNENHKKNELLSGMAEMKLLGELLAFNLRENRGVKNNFQHVKDALKNAGLDENAVDARKPQSAFARACKELEGDGLIDELRNDKKAGKILFQLSKKFFKDDIFEGGNEVEYKKHAKLLLDTATGILECKDDEIRQQAQNLLNKHMDMWTTSDVSSIVNRLFEQHGDLIPIGVGVFFVPDQYAGHTQKVQNFLSALGRKMSRFPVPAGTQQGDQSVQTAMVDYLAAMVEEHEQNIEKFSLNTREDTIEKVAESINNTRMKISAYAMYLQDKSKNLLQTVEEADQKLAMRIEGLTVERKNAPIEDLSERNKVFNVLTNEPKTMKEIVELAGLNDTCYNFMNKMIEKGKVVKEGKGYKLP